MEWYQVWRCNYIMNKFWKPIDFSLLTLPAITILVLISVSVIFFYPKSGYENNSCDRCLHSVYAQSDGNSSGMNANNVSQMWIDKTSGIGINLAYSPTKPLVDSPTNLKFIVHNLKGGNNLKDLTAHVGITSNSSGQERTFKFSNITAPNGDFSLKYIFPDYGTYQVITTVRSNTSGVALASFPITIPVQAGGTFTNPTMIMGIVIIIIGIVALVVVVIKIKK